MSGRGRHKEDLAAIVICIAAICYLLFGSLGHVPRQILHVTPLVLAQPNPPLSGTGFAANSVYPSTPPASIRPSVHFYGSWLNGDASTGSAHSAWYTSKKDIYIFVAGYPNRPGNHLFLEISTPHSNIQRIPLTTGDDPGEHWRIKRISVQQVRYSAMVRIVAIDGTTGPGGWLGFSEPFEIKSSDSVPLAGQFAALLLATCSSLLFFLFPGLLLRQAQSSRGRSFSFIWIPVPGLLLMALLGLAAWLGPHAISARLIVRVSLWALTLYALYHFTRFRISNYTTRIERRVLIVLAVLILLAMGKAAYSLGPVGELYGNYISKTLEVGARGDSRIPFHVVQIAGTRNGPYSELARILFEPYNFSDRGPLAGLAATPVVLAAPIALPRTPPSQPWAVFDPQGFSAYRVAMVVMAAASLLTVFGLARVFLDEEWAFLAFLLTVTAPFVIHEIYFTWPKLEAAAFVLLSAYLIFRKRFFFAGFFLGIGYLFHPLALLSSPALACLAFLSEVPGLTRARPSSRAILKGLTLLFLGLAIWLLAWQRINAKHFTQGVFLQYLRQCDNLTPTWPHWIEDRSISLANTLVPLNVFLFHSNHNQMNAVGSPSPAIIHFFLQYWVALPFGAGLLFFWCLLWILAVSCAKARAWFIVVFLVPLATFTIYWGSYNSGMLREGLHPWFLGLMIFSVAIWRKHLVHRKLFGVLCSYALLFRGIETLLMMLLPTIWTRHEMVQKQFALTDWAALTIMIVCALWLFPFTFRASLWVANRTTHSETGTKFQY